MNKKIFLFIGLGLLLLSVSFVAGYSLSTILTKQEFAEKYPEDPLIRTIQGCGGRTETECIAYTGRDITCVVRDETTAPDGMPIIKFKCFE